MALRLRPVESHFRVVAAFLSILLRSCSIAQDAQERACCSSTVDWMPPSPRTRGHQRSFPTKTRYSCGQYLRLWPIFQVGHNWMDDLILATLSPKEGGEPESGPSGGVSDSGSPPRAAEGLGERAGARQQGQQSNSGSFDSGSTDTSGRVSPRLPSHALGPHYTWSS